MMSRFNSLQGRALQLAEQVGDGIRNVPDHAQKWFKAGVAVGATRAGGKAVVRSTRRHPMLAATAAAAALAAAAGLLVYAHHRRRKAAEAEDAIEGQARRVEARRTAPSTAPDRGATTRRPGGVGPVDAGEA